MSFTALVARMVASAWYPVVYFHLSLGASDKLAELIAHLQQRHRIANDERPDRITYTVVSLASADERLARLIRDRTHNVPYRLIRPFYEDELAAIRRRFSESLQRTITPLYQIALNQGYAVWSA